MKQECINLLFTKEIDPRNKMLKTKSMDDIIKYKALKAIALRTIKTEPKKF